MQPDFVSIIKTYGRVAGVVYLKFIAYTAIPYSYTAKDRRKVCLLTVNLIYALTCLQPQQYKCGQNPEFVVWAVKVRVSNLF